MARRGGAPVRTRRRENARRRNATQVETAAPDARRIAFSVHLFTASGAACAMLALIAATRAEWVAMFAWLGLALVIDGVDGTLARHFRVAEILPRWSGDALDLVVDFTTYVFVPAYALGRERPVAADAVALPLASRSWFRPPSIAPTAR